MKVVRALIIVAVILIVTLSVVVPAFAWYFPILGFTNPCAGYPLQGFKPVPGSPQWPYFPDSGRGETVLPGSAYCPIHGRLNFGSRLPFATGPAAGGISIGGQKAVATTNNSTEK